MVFLTTKKQTHNRKQSANLLKIGAKILQGLQRQAKIFVIMFCNLNSINLFSLL